MIEGVERLQPELHRRSLRHPEILVDSDIGLVRGWPVHYAHALAAQMAERRDAERGRVEEASVGSFGAARTGNEVGPVAADAHQVLTGGYGERDTGGEGIDAGALPSTGHEPYDGHAVGQFGELVDRVQAQDVRAVEIGWPAIVPEVIRIGKTRAAAVAAAVNGDIGNE